MLWTIPIGIALVGLIVLLCMLYFPPMYDDLGRKIKDKRSWK
jgi:hypothetical protein